VVARCSVRVGRVSALDPCLRHREPHLALAAVSSACGWSVKRIVSGNWRLDSLALSTIYFGYFPLFPFQPTSIAIFFPITLHCLLQHIRFCEPRRHRSAPAIAGLSPRSCCLNRARIYAQSLATDLFYSSYLKYQCKLQVASCIHVLDLSIGMEKQGTNFIALDFSIYFSTILECASRKHFAARRTVDILFNGLTADICSNFVTAKNKTY